MAGQDETAEWSRRTQTVICGDNQDITGREYSGGLYARLPHRDGRTYGTFRTAAVRVTGSHVTFRHCRFANTAGPGAHGGPDGSGVGQAIALYLDGDDICLEDCVLEGWQDTLFLAPLPQREVEKDGFRGPGEFLPRTDRSVIFRRCRIEGSVDFVFGGATALFEDCEFVSRESGYVFAPCTPPRREGFTARRCRFTAWDGVPEASCYVARPWREHAAVHLENCTFGPHIHPDLWAEWSGRIAAGSVHFEAENCTFTR